MFRLKAADLLLASTLGVLLLAWALVGQRPYELGGSGGGGPIPPPPISSLQSVPNPPAPTTKWGTVILSVAPGDGWQVRVRRHNGEIVAQTATTAHGPNILVVPANERLLLDVLTTGAVSIPISSGMIVSIVIP